jgi:hypothetical protein
MMIYEFFKVNNDKESMKPSSSNIVLSVQQNNTQLNASGSCEYGGVQVRYWNGWSLNYGEIFNTKTRHLSLLAFRNLSSHFIDGSTSP